MSHNTFFASDHHLGHAKILEFVHWDGTPIRSGFSCVDEMNEHMIEQHNKVVKQYDRVYFLGDVVINRRYLSLIPRFNGKKRLLLGNHDVFKNKDYFNAGFEELHAFKKFEGFIATHIPVHRESLRPSWAKNVHGHLHRNIVKKKVRSQAELIQWQGDETIEVPDTDYLNVCVEQLDNYTPISIDEIRKKLYG